MQTTCCKTHYPGLAAERAFCLLIGLNTNSFQRKHNIAWKNGSVIGQDAVRLDAISLSAFLCLQCTCAYGHICVCIPIPVHTCLLKRTARSNSCPSVVVPACPWLLSHTSAAEAYCGPQPSQCLCRHSFAFLVVQWCVILPELRPNGCDLISDSSIQT